MSTTRRRRRSTRERFASCAHSASTARRRIHARAATATGSPTQETNVQTGFPHGAITQFDLSSDQVTAKIVVGRDVGWLDVDTVSGVWALDRADLMLTHIDPQSGRVLKRIPLHHIPCCVSAGHD